MQQPHAPPHVSYFPPVTRRRPYCVITFPTPCSTCRSCVRPTERSREARQRRRLPRLQGAEGGPEDPGELEEHDSGAAVDGRLANLAHVDRARLHVVAGGCLGVAGHLGEAHQGEALPGRHQEAAGEPEEDPGQRGHRGGGEDGGGGRDGWGKRGGGGRGEWRAAEVPNSKLSFCLL